MTQWCMQKSFHIPGERKRFDYYLHSCNEMRKISISYNEASSNFSSVKCSVQCLSANIIPVSKKNLGISESGINKKKKKEGN